jgi:DNA-binding response OmpR family regulator
MSKQVLIIDDIWAMLDLVEDILQMAGYEVMTASDARRHHPDNCVKTSLSKEGHFR